MEMGGVAIGASTVTSVFTATLRISQAVYELKAVGEQTRDLLDTTKHIDDSMRNVRSVRRQKSGLLTTTEKEWIDREIKNSEKAVSDVAALIEPARVDMQTKSNNTKDIRFKNRIMFVLRDSPNVAVQLTKLSIATQGLNAAMGVLCNREGYGGLVKLNGGTVKRPDRRRSSPTRKAPPPYELSEFMNRRRTTGAVPRLSPLNHKTSRVSFVDEDRSADESVPLATSHSHATLRTKSSWATTDEPGDSRELGKVETRHQESESAAPTFSSIFRDAPYLDRIEKSPACIPVLTFGQATPPMNAEALAAADGHGPRAVDPWRWEPVQAREEQQDSPTPIRPAQTGRGYLSPTPVLPASASQPSLGTSMARETMPGNSSNYGQHGARPEELLPSHPPLAPYNSEPPTAPMPGASPPPIPPRPTSFQSRHQHAPSTHSLHDRYVQQAGAANPPHLLPRPSPFHFLTPPVPASGDANSFTWGDNRPNKAMHPPTTSTTTSNPSRTHQPPLPYPYNPPSATPFPPLTHVLSDPPPQRPTPVRPPRRKPIPTATPPTSPAPTPHLSLAETATPNLRYYKPLPNLPFGRNASMASVTSTASEPAGGVGVGGARISRGKMWLEHHAERAFAMGESATDPLSGGFLAPPPPQQRVREV